MNRFSVFFSAVIAFAAGSAVADPVVERLETIPPSTSTSPGALVPVNGRVFLRYVGGATTDPEIFASVNGTESQAVDLIVVEGDVELDISLYSISLESLGANVGDSVALTAGSLFQESPVWFEVVERDDDNPIVESRTVTFFPKEWPTHVAMIARATPAGSALESCSTLHPINTGSHITKLSTMTEHS